MNTQIKTEIAIGMIAVVAIIVGAAIWIEGKVANNITRTGQSVTTQPVAQPETKKDNSSMFKKTYSISGQVINGQGKTIEVYDTDCLNITGGKIVGSAVVNSKGNFSITGLSPGEYKLSGAFFVPYSQDITLDDQDVTSVTFNWEEPTEGLPTEVSKHLETVPSRSLPDDKIILPNGQNLADYTKSRGIVVPDCMYPGRIHYSVSGHITNGQRATVEIYDTSCIKKGITTVDGKGTFSITGLSPGEYRLAASQPGFTFSPNYHDIAIESCIDNPDLTSITFDRQETR